MATEPVRNTPCWNDDRNLIKIIEGYPVLYTKKAKSMKRDQFIQAKANSWEQVSLKTNWSVSKCQRKFIDLRCKYIIIKNMIRSGDLTEEFVRKRPKVSHFLDGVFDFLDPHVSDIPNWRLPAARVNRFYKALLAAKPKRNSMVELKIKNKKNNFVGLDIFPQEIEPPSILPTIECDDSENIVNETVIESSVNSKGNEETEEFILSDLNAPVNDDIIKDITPDSIQMFLMKYSNDNDDEFDIKQYFNELAALLCARLVLGKRQNFLNQVDLLVSEILEG